MWVNGLKVDLPIVPNPEWDMAMLHVPGLKGIKDVVWADHKPKVGDTSRLLGWGCPLGHYRQIESVGRVVSIDGRDLMYDVPMCIGDSGGPVYDQSNRLVGLIVRMIKSNHHAVVQYLAE
jgi:V8-like Glu-specific endopeptidase